MSDEQLYQLAERTGRLLQNSDSILVAAESCTGGWLAKVMTDVPGSSSWFERGFVTYTNQAKSEMLGVSEETLQQYGAVSEETVTEMARGALHHSHGDISVAISGIAGPGGGSPEKPVGTVCFAWGKDDDVVKSERLVFSGDRESVRRQSVIHALKGVCELV